MPGPPASPDELALPRARPYRALRRTLCVVALLLVALVVVWVAWDRRTAARLESQLAEYRRRGEPARLSDFAPPSLPDDRNAVTYLHQAAAAFVHPLHPNFRWELIATDAPEADEERIVRLWLDANRRAFELLRRASGFPAAWPVPAPASAVGDAIDPLAALAEALITASTFAHRDGDDTAALDYLADAFALARLHGASADPQAQWARFRLQASVAAQVEALAPVLRVQGDAPAASSRPAKSPTTRPTPATRQRVRQLIDALLGDEAAERREAVRAVHAERILRLETLLAPAAELHRDDGSPLDPGVVLHRFLRAAARPYRRHAALGEMAEITAFARAAEQPSQAAALAIAPRATSPLRHPTGLYPVDALDLELPTTYASRFVLVDFRIRVLRRNAAVLLAARLYQADRNPRPLTGVRQLVPAYLPRVPADPLATDAELPLPPAATQPTPQR